MLKSQSNAKKLEKQLGQIGQIVKEVGEKLSEQEIRNARKAVMMLSHREARVIIPQFTHAACAFPQAERSEAELKPQRLGKHKYTDVPLSNVVPLTDELRGSLRTAVPKGSLLLDRQKSLEKRNVLEPREKLGKRRRYVLRQYKKKSTRLDDE